MSTTFILKPLVCKNFHEYKRNDNLFATSKRSKRKHQHNRKDNANSNPDIGTEIPELVGSNTNVIADIVRESNTDDLQKIYDTQQIIRRQNKQEYNSDSDSEAELDNAINMLTGENIEVFNCCIHSPLTLNTLVVSTSLISIILVLILCFYKLYTSNEEYIITGYLAILSIIIGQLLGVFGFLKNKNKTD